MTEEKVLKKLGIDDFRHITKNKVIKMASMLDRVDPEVAKKAIEQFPDFSNTAKEILRVCNVKCSIMQHFRYNLSGCR